jgi:NAD(P)-dependent dehydrogenase (short-subunit alcohol dehydrogenase family)
LTRSLGKYNIRVHAVSPGVMETPMIGTYDNAARDGALNRTPFRAAGRNLGCGPVFNL